ncbi:unnamed protein product, partial [Polarella glacialis]
VMRNVTHLGEFIKMLRNLKDFSLFNPESPTGHYVLDLGISASSYVVEALSLLDRWETSLARKKGLPDVSENGNFSNVRNVKYNGANLEAASFAEWIVPESE